MCASWGGRRTHRGQLDLDGAGIVDATNENINNAFFALLDNLPLTQITSVMALLLVALFFISGADANTYVLGMLSCKGTLYPRKPVLLAWGALTGLCVIVLLLANGLRALQQAALLSALPFTIIITLLGVALTKELRSDPHYQALHPHAPELPAVPGAFVENDRNLYSPEADPVANGRATTSS